MEAPHFRKSKVIHSTKGRNSTKKSPLIRESNQIVVHYLETEQQKFAYVGQKAGSKRVKEVIENESKELLPKINKKLGTDDYSVKDLSQSENVNYELGLYKLSKEEEKLDTQPEVSIHEKVKNKIKEKG